MERAYHIVEMVSHRLRFNVSNWGALFERYIHEALDKAIVSPEKIIFGECFTYTMCMFTAADVIICIYVALNLLLLLT